MIGTIRAALLRAKAYNTTIVLGVSGGIDSVAMMDAICALSNDLQLTVHVAHANHKLRGEESDTDEAFVRELATSYGIAFDSMALDVYKESDASGKGIEAAARTLRYAYLQSVAKNTSATHILTAHNLDDVAETFILNLARGTGLDGLAGIREHQITDTGTHLVRPMIALSRSTIEDYMRERNITWHEDSTNSETLFLRNKIRHNILPVLRSELGRDISRQIASTANRLSEAQAIIREVVVDHLHCIRWKGSMLELDLEELQNVSSPMQIQLIRHAITSMIGYPPSEDATVRVHHLVQSSSGSRTNIIKDWIALRERASIVMGKAPVSEPIKVAIKHGERYVAGLQQLHIELSTNVAPTPDANVAELDAEAIKGTLVWRSWEDGDRFSPLGMKGSVLVSDLLANAGVDHSRRKQATVVADDLGIVWVCGIRIAHRARILSTTESAYIITFTDTTA